MRATDRVFTTAASFRLHLQKNLYDHLGARPAADPLAGARLPRPARCPPTSPSAGRAPRAALLARRRRARSRRCRSTTPWASPRSAAARPRRSGARGRFLARGLPRYADERNDVDDGAASGLSPYLHFGHVSAHEVFGRVRAPRGVGRPPRSRPSAHGSREGWWNASPAADAFLDELVTWREIGFNMCAHRDDYDRFESLPDWARATLEEHARDRAPTSTRAPSSSSARTRPRFWNAAQRQLVREGRIAQLPAHALGKKCSSGRARSRRRSPRSSS